MYCPGQNKDLEMPLEGETRGLEVEPSPRCSKCSPLGPVRHADLKVHPIPSSLGQHQHVSLAFCDINGRLAISPGIGVLGSSPALSDTGDVTLDRSSPSWLPLQMGIKMRPQ